MSNCSLLPTPNNFASTMNHGTAVVSRFFKSTLLIVLLLSLTNKPAHPDPTNEDYFIAYCYRELGIGSFVVPGMFDRARRMTGDYDVSQIPPESKYRSGIRPKIVCDFGKNKIGVMGHYDKNNSSRDSVSVYFKEHHFAMSFSWPSAMDLVVSDPPIVEYCSTFPHAQKICSGAVTFGSFPTMPETPPPTASFECPDSMTPVRTFICEHPALAKADREVAVASQKAMTSQGASSDVRDKQMIWRDEFEQVCPLPSDRDATNVMKYEYQIVSAKACMLDVYETKMERMHSKRGIND